VGFVRDEPFYSIYLTDLSFSEPNKLTDDQITESSARWSPDGQWIAYAANVGFADKPPTAAWEVRIIHPDGSGKRTIVPRSQGISFPSVRWSPDGTQLAITRYDDRAVTHRVSLVSIESGREVPISDGNSNDRVLAWLP
jgi:Tol biopolymer transport system component